MDHCRTPHVGVSSRAVASSVVERTRAFPVTLSAVLAITPTRQAIGCWNPVVTALTYVPRVSRLGQLFVVLIGQGRSLIPRSFVNADLPPSVHMHSRIFRVFECVWGLVYIRDVSHSAPTTNLFLRLIGNGSTAC